MVRPRKNSRRERSLFSFTTIDRASVTRYALLGGLTLLVAAGAFANALGNVTKISHPVVALRFDGSQPAALTALADESLLDASRPEARRAAERYARDAVRVSPLAPGALRILGLATADVRRPLAEMPLLAMSQRLSRRDLGAHLWWIEYYVGKGQAKKALQSYDLALRTSIPARSILLPVLYSALENPEIQSELVPYFREERAWVPELLIYATANGRNVSRLVRPLIASGTYPKSDEFSRLARQTMENLLANGNVQGVERVYAALPQADPALLVKPKLSRQAADDRHIPVAWDLNGSSTAGAELEGRDITAGEPRYTLRAFVGSGESDIVARKLLFLKPGNYRFSSTASVTLAAPQQEVTWVISCIAQPNGALLSHQLVADQKPVSRTSSFDVPEACPAQILKLQMAAEGGLSGMEILIDSLDINPT